MNTFLRIPVGGIILPTVNAVLSSDIICFKSALPHWEWKELSSRKHIEFVDKTAGVAVARETGKTVVGVSLADNQTTFVEVSSLTSDFLKVQGMFKFCSVVRYFFHYGSLLGIAGSVFFSCPFWNLKKCGLVMFHLLCPMYVIASLYFQFFCERMLFRRMCTVFWNFFIVFLLDDICN